MFSYPVQGVGQPGLRINAVELHRSIKVWAIAPASDFLPEIFGACAESQPSRSSSRGRTFAWRILAYLGQHVLGLPRSY